MKLKVALVAVAVCLLPSIARAAEPIEDSVRAAARAFSDELLALELPKADLEAGAKLPVLLDGINATDRHVDVAGLVRATLADAAPSFVLLDGGAAANEKRARAHLRFEVSAARAASDGNKVLLVTCRAELVRLASRRVLASLVHESGVVNGTPVRPGDAGWDRLESAVADLRTPASVVAAAVARLVAAIEKDPKLQEAGFIVVPARSRRATHVVDLPHVAARITAALVLAKKPVVSSDPSVVALAKGRTDDAPRPLVLQVRATVVDGAAGPAIDLELASPGRTVLAIPGEDEHALEKKPGPVPEWPGEGALTSAKVVRVRGDLVALSVGSDDGIVAGHVFEIWRGRTKLSRAVVTDDVTRDLAWAKLDYQPGMAVEPGDSAYRYLAAEQQAEIDRAATEAARGLIACFEARGGTPRRVRLERAVAPAWWTPLAARTLLRILGESKAVKVVDADPAETIRIDVKQREPAFGTARIETLVCAIGEGDAWSAAGTGRVVTIAQEIVPRARWKEHFARAFGPEEERALVDAFRDELAKAKLDAAGAKPVVAVKDAGETTLAAALAGVLLETGRVDRVVRGDASATLVLEVGVEGEDAQEGGRSGARYRARAALSRAGGGPVAQAERIVFKSE